MKKLYLSVSDKKIAGLCGGIGHFLSIDPNIIRLLFVILAIITAFAPLVFVYVIAWVIIPKEPPGVLYADFKKLYRSKTNKKIAGICGGIGKYLNADSSLIRLIVVFLCLITAVFPIAAAYIIAWIILPEENSQEEIEIK